MCPFSERTWAKDESPTPARAEEGDSNGLQRHAGYGVAPVRIAQPAQGAHLKCVGRAWRQTSDGDGTNDRDGMHFRPRSRLAVGAHRRITRRVAHGFGNRFAPHDRLTAVRTV